jgi:methyl-accepting chemotaxis protein
MEIKGLAWPRMPPPGARRFGIRQIQKKNVSKLISVPERFSAADLTAHSGLHGNDEFSEVDNAFDHMAE